MMMMMTKMDRRGSIDMMFPRWSAAPINALLSSPLFLTALSLLFLFRNLSSTSPHPSFRQRPTGKMRGASGGARTTTTTAAAAATRTPTTATRAKLAFSTPDSLSDWLQPRLPSDSFASWGVKPGTKTVHNLWLELSQGETSLLPFQHPHQYDGDVNDSSSVQQVVVEEEEPSPPREHSLLRTVHVATVRIWNPSGGLLVETQQLLSDGNVRARHRPLSEKMKTGESVEDAAVRAIREELGGGAIRIVPGSHETRVEERVSASYPGLPALYVLHSVEAEVEGLPLDGEFSTEEVGECCEASGEISRKAVFVRRHFWKWVYGNGDGDGDSVSSLQLT